MINNYLSEPIENSFDFEVLRGEIIPLELEYYTQAREKCKQVTKARQWQTFLNLLAVLGFKSWLRERAIETKLDIDKCSVGKLETDKMLDVVYNLKLGQYKLVLIATESLIDGEVKIPKIVLDLPEYMAHFYVLLEVWEEEEQASISGFLSHEQLQEVRNSVQLEDDEGIEIYQVPLAKFDLDANHLLSKLRLADIPFPEPAVSPSFVRVAAQTAINIASWVRGELDAVAESLNWGNPTLLVPKFMNIPKEFDEAIATLAEKGMKIPKQALGSCKDIDIDGFPLQILVSPWLLPPANSDNIAKIKDSLDPSLEYSLLVILRIKDGIFLPEGMKLQVKYLNTVLSEKVVQGNQKYLSSRVIGDRSDRFEIFIIHDGIEREVAKFEFNPD